MNGIWRVLRFGIGVLLLTSAAWKIHWHTHTPPQLYVAWLDASGVVFPASAFELGLGSLLVVGAWSRAVRWISISTFCVFACVSLTEALSGSNNCGCFGGGVHIPPWIMAGFDLLCLILLLRCEAKIHDSGWFGLRDIRTILALTIIATGLTTIAAWVSHRSPVVVAQSSEIPADPESFGTPGSLVLLDPEKLAGKPFRLCSHIDIGPQLNTGVWIILLVHHDCGACAGAVPRYQAALSTTGGTRLVIIEMPPYGEPGELAPWPTSIGLFGKLDTTRDWFATTPVAILLKNGVVQAATDGEHAGTPNATWLSATSDAHDAKDTSSAPDSGFTVANETTK